MADGVLGPEVSLVHAVPGRLHLRVPSLEGDTDAMSAFVETIAEVPGLVRIIGRPSTGTLILEYDGDLAEIVPALVSRGGMSFVRAPVPPPVSQTLRLGLAVLDQKIAAQSEGTFDMRAALAVLLIGLAVFQTARGQLMGPATTLLVAALSLIEPGRKA
jgi:hypothetical protein